MARILVVDDEPGVRESLRLLLKDEAEIDAVGDVDSALRAISDTPPDLILLDLVMPGRGGLELLAELEERGCEAPVIVLTATNTVAAAVEAMKRGAADFLTKPFELDPLRIKVRQLLSHRALSVEVERLREEVSDRQQLGEMVGRSPVMRDIFRTVERIADAAATVLLTGESGTGKELVARALHDLSSRATTGKLVAVNCAAIPHALIESELFGHERGSFTGATERRIGRFEAASGGTLLLDEIGELDGSLQVKLLRALQERVIERVGSNEPIHIDVRVVAATNLDLDLEVREGRFRSDLYYRINVVPIHLPPLRERREDIRLIAEKFLATHTVRARDASKPDFESRLSAGSLAALEGYAWPGNVRELQNALEHGMAMCTDGLIEVEDLPVAVARTGRAEALREEWRRGRISYEEAISRFETEILRETLERNDWNQTRTADELGITRRLLKLKMDRFGVGSPDE